MYKQTEEKKKERNFYHKTHRDFLSVLAKTGKQERLTNDCEMRYHS